MPDERRLIYRDADVSLSYIEEIRDRMAVLDALLELSVRRDDPTKIVTSVLSVTEVAYAQAEKGAGALDSAVLTRIDDFWTDREAILLAEFHELIAREARDLIRSAVAHGWSLRANDAVHLATAKHLGVAEFHTTTSGSTSTRRSSASRSSVRGPSSRGCSSSRSSEIGRLGAAAPV